MSNLSAFCAPRECEHPYTISEINAGIAAIIEAGNTLVWVEGEISTWKPASSGHCYFRLKDETSQIPAVVWRQAASELTFSPADGMAVMAIASIRVYERGGYYQLDIHRMQPLGQGALHAAFLKLKARLEREGLFDPSFKKPLPLSISRIGVVTSKNGAALRDIVRVISSRAPQTEIVLADVAVQGDAAAPQIARAIGMFNEYGQVDCLIVGRGGGSAEDLQAFNEEIVARAIFASKIPIISAVGHEIDFTIADFTADIRAATPSAAAELAVIDSQDARRHVMQLSTRFGTAFSRYVLSASSGYRRLSTSRAFRKPWRLYLEMQQRCDENGRALKESLLRVLTSKTAQLASLGKQLDALSPLAVLARGYSVVSKADTTVVRSAHQVDKGETVTLQFAQGKAQAQIVSTER